jgi:hypothetical protein
VLAGIRAGQPYNTDATATVSAERLHAHRDHDCRRRDPGRVWRGRDGDPRSSDDVVERATADHDDGPAGRICGNVRGRPAHGHVRRRESAHTGERKRARCIDEDDGDHGALSRVGTARYCTDPKRAASRR